jgi:hypothetical protein
MTAASTAIAHRIRYNTIRERCVSTGLIDSGMHTYILLLLQRVSVTVTEVLNWRLDL